MNVCLDNEVNYILKVKGDPQESSLNHFEDKGKTRRILKVPSMWADDFNMTDRYQILERKLSPSCFIEYLLDPDKIGTLG
jgi:hypothetical protein